MIWLITFLKNREAPPSLCKYYRHVKNYSYFVQTDDFQPGLCGLGHDHLLFESVYSIISMGQLNIKLKCPGFFLEVKGLSLTSNSILLCLKSSSGLLLQANLHQALTLRQAKPDELTLHIIENKLEEKYFKQCFRFRHS